MTEITRLSLLSDTGTHPEQVEFLIAPMRPNLVSLDNLSEALLRLQLVDRLQALVATSEMDPEDRLDSYYLLQSIRESYDRAYQLHLLIESRAS